MKGIIKLLYDNDCPDKMEIFLKDDYGYEIEVNTDVNEPFEKIINDEESLVEHIDKQLEYFEWYESVGEYRNFYKAAKKQPLDLLQNAQYVSICFPFMETITYIKLNPTLKSKQIIINNCDGLNIESLKMLKQVLCGQTRNILFKLENNDKLISFTECERTYEIIDSFVKKVASYNFSVFEKIMYVYDFVRNRLYVHEGDNEALHVSRDLSSVLLGDKIVCQGYTRIFIEILDKLGIEARDCILENKNNGKRHSRAEIYVKDEKYDIDGVYYFDATWDRKREKDDNSYLYSYRYFAKTRMEMGDKYIDVNFPEYSLEMPYELEYILRNEGVSKIPRDMCKSVNYMSNIIKQEPLLSNLVLFPGSPFYGKVDNDKIIEEFDSIHSYFNRPIPAEVYLQALLKIRTQQYYECPEIYPFNIFDFYKTYKISGWEFTCTDRERLLLLLESKEFCDHLKMEKFNNYKDDNLEKQVGQVRLARSLKSIYESRLNQ